MNRYILILAVFMLPIAFLATSCGDDETCDISNVTYTNSVGTILNSSCAFAGCHNAGNMNGSLANYADAAAFAAFNNGANLIGAINHDSGFEPMPYPTGTAKLSDCNIDKIEAWITAGTPE